MKAEYIYSCIDHINNLSLTDEKHPLGVLTSINRNDWASLREKLVNLGNSEALNKIDSSLYCISLDDHDSNDYDDMAHNFLHGNPLNRWFDKSFQLIVTKNANAAINFEHSWGDGVAVLRLFTELFADVEKFEHVTTDTNIDNVKGMPKELIQKLGKLLRQNIS
jgi:carnitine O-palmitoyltransferase 2